MHYISNIIVFVLHANMLEIQIVRQTNIMCTVCLHSASHPQGLSLAAVASILPPWRNNRSSLHMYISDVAGLWCATTKNKTTGFVQALNTKRPYNTAVTEKR